MPFGEFVHIEQDLFASKIACLIRLADRQGIHAIARRAARIHRIILAVFKARVIPEAMLAIRHRTVILLDAADNLVKQLVFKRL